MPFTYRAVRLGLILLLITAGTLLAAGWAMNQAKRQAMLDDTQRASQQLALYANSLHTLIERYRTLPAVLALDPQLRQALQGPIDAATSRAVTGPGKSLVLPSGSVMRGMRAFYSGLA